jgi:hypothetical protein
MSNGGCLPGKAGGSPNGFRVSSDVVEDSDDHSERYRDSLHESWLREREVRREGSYLAYAELILRPDGEMVSADLYGVDKLA